MARVNKSNEEVKEVKPKIKCVGECKRELIVTNFYNTNSPLFPSGKINICKKCLNEMVKVEDIETVYRVLQLMDIPFLYDYWDLSCQKNPKNPFGKYITMSNSMPQFRGLLWSDSNFDSSATSRLENIDNSRGEEKEEMVYNEEWRGTYSTSDLKYLEEYYRDLQGDFKIVTRNHKDYARKIAKASLAMDRAYDDMVNGVQGSDTRYKNLKDTFDQLSKSAQFSEDKRGANDVGLGCFGVVFDKVEKKMWIPQHTPLEKDDYDNLLESFATINKSL